MKSIFIGTIIFIMLLSITGVSQAQTTVSTTSRDNPEPVNWNSKGIIFRPESNASRGLRINDNWSIQANSDTPGLIIQSNENKNSEVIVPLTAGYTNPEDKPINLFNYSTVYSAPLSDLSFSCLLQQHDFASYWAYNFRWKAFSSLLDSLKNNSNLRILDIDTYGWDSYYYAGTWIGDNKGWAYALNYTSSDNFSNLIKDWGNKKYRVTDLEVNFYDDELNYGAVAIEDQSGFSWIYNTTISGLQTWFTEQENQNRRIIDVEGYRPSASGELRFAGVAETNSPSYSWKAVANYLWSDFESLLKSLNSDGYHISDYEVYCYHGRVYYAGVWIKDSKGSGWMLNFTDQADFKRQLNSYINDNKLRPFKLNIWDGLEHTAVQPIDQNPITDFKLVQNFPNPFNPTTTFTYQITQKSAVTLSIFNVNGQLVDILVNEEHEPGNYSHQWNAGHLSSGIYYYQFKAGNYLEKGRCVLLK